MDIPIKMIDFAIATCWIFLIMFFATAAYSVTDLGLNFGNPRIGTATDGRTVVSLPVTIANNGYYSIGSFNFTTKVLGDDGSTITEGSTLIPAIGVGEKVSIIDNMTLDIDHLLQSSQNFLFNDTQLDIVENVGMVIGEVIPVQASGNVSVPWGAPFYNLKLEEPQYSMLNHTHMSVIVPMSFDNHASFDIVGEAEMRMYNSTNQLIGFGQNTIDVLQQSHYDGHVELDVGISSITQTGRFELNFQTSLFSSGSRVIPYG
jgi:hypothetical protein